MLRSSIRIPRLSHLPSLRGRHLGHLVFRYSSLRRFRASLLSLAVRLILLQVPHVSYLPSLRVRRLRARHLVFRYSPLLYLLASLLI